MRSRLPGIASPIHAEGTLPLALSKPSRPLSATPATAAVPLSAPTSAAADASYIGLVALSRRSASSLSTSSPATSTFSFSSSSSSSSSPVLRAPCPRLDGVRPLSFRPLTTIISASTTSLRQALPSITMQQSRTFAGRAGGFKRKKKASRPRTIHQKGLGKRMEMFWPQHDSHRLRIPMYENSRRHVIYAHHLKRWMVMWYRNGIQVFRTFPARGARFEQGRMCAILFYEKLKEARKLGVPKPDQCRSGVRGVFFDKEERSWVARWSSSGLKKYAVYNTEELGFQDAYRKAIETRVQSIRQQHQFVFQRTRWRGQRRPLGQLQT